MRSFWFWTHFSVAAITGLFIFSMATTGTLLTYEAQIERWARNSAIDSPEGASPLTVDELVEKARTAGASTGSVLVLPRDRTDMVEVSLGRRQTLYLNPYTGNPMPEAGAGTAEFFHRVTAIHRWLAFDGVRSELGAAINSASNLAFSILLLTGAILWWPRKWTWRLLSGKVGFRRGLPNRQAMYFNWHQVIGLWTLVPLLAIVLSGVIISYPWASSLLYAAYGEAVPAGRGEGPGQPGGAGQGRGRATRIASANRSSTTGESSPVVNSLDALLQQVTAEPGWNRVRLTLPEADADDIDIAVDSGNGIQTSKITSYKVSRNSASVTPQFGTDNASRAGNVRRWFRFLHTGEVYGLPGQTIAGLAALGASLLSFTGLAMGLRRLRRMAGKSSRPLSASS